jgi:hypothetical protein
VEYETPQQLANRLHLGREELCQRLLTMLILDAPYPRWNTRSSVCERGLAFLRELWELSGFSSWPGDELLFVDEFELPRRHEREKGGAPDYGVLWDDRVWMIELKTEVASHRATQIPGYLDLARHHHPDASIDLTYLTPPMAYDFRGSGDAVRYAQVTWPQLDPVLRSVWSEPRESGQRAVVNGLLRAIDRMEAEPPAEFLTALRSRSVPAPAAAANPVQVALELAAATAEDGILRALDHDARDLEDLLELRLEVREQLAASPVGSPLRTVMPWIWNAATTDGLALVPAGERTGAELRLSRYREAVY